MTLLWAPPTKYRQANENFYNMVLTARQVCLFSCLLLWPIADQVINKASDLRANTLTQMVTIILASKFQAVIQSEKACQSLLEFFSPLTKSLSKSL